MQRGVFLFSLAVHITVSVLLLTAQPLRDAESHILNGDAAYDNHNYQEAISAYKKAIDINNNEYRGHYGIAQSYFSIGSYDDALEFIVNAERLARNNPGVLILKGRILTALARFSEAQEILNRILMASPTDIIAHLALAESYAVGGEFENASREVQTILSFSPDHRETLLSCAFLFESIGDLEAAEIYLNTALEKYENDPLVHYRDFLFSMNTKKWERALEALDKLSSYRNYNKKEDLHRGRISYMIKDSKSAAVYLERYLKESPHDVEALKLLASVYESLGRISETERILENLAYRFPKEEMYPIILESLIANAPLDDPKRRRYGIDHREAGNGYFNDLRYKEAEFEYRRSIQLDPYSEENWRAYTRFFRETNQLAKYLDKLMAWKNLGRFDSEAAKLEVDEEIALVSSSLPDKPSTRWEIDQFSSERGEYKIFFSAIRGDESFYHGSDKHLMNAFINIFSGYDFFESSFSAEPVGSRNEIIAQAQTRGADYSLALSFFSSDDTFSIRGDFSTVGFPASRRELRFSARGRNKIKEAMVGFLDLFSSFFLPKATVIAKSGETLIAVNQGEINGVVPDQAWTLFKANALKSVSMPPYVEWSEEDHLGTVTIIDVDREIAEGRFEAKDIYSEVTEGDTLLLLPPPDENPIPEQQPQQPINTPDPIPSIEMLSGFHQIF